MLLLLHKISEFTFNASATPSSVSRTISLDADGFVDGILNVTRPLTLVSVIAGLNVTDEVMVTIVMYDPDGKRDARTGELFKVTVFIVCQSPRWIWLEYIIIDSCTLQPLL